MMKTLGAVASLFVAGLALQFSFAAQQAAEPLKGEDAISVPMLKGEPKLDPGPAEIPAPPAAAKPSLYKRLGGLPAIASVVDDFLDRLVADKVIVANPRVQAALAHASPAYLKFQITSLVCNASGGPCVYAGKPMKEAHAGLSISDPEWAAMTADLKATLAKFAVPEAEQGELLAVVEGTRADIVAPKK